MDQLSKLGPFAALAKMWNDLAPSQRVVLVAFVAIAVVVVGFTAMLATRPRMSVLFSGLGSEDAGAIVQKLAEEKIPYELSGDGSTIEVPSDKVHDQRLKMATQGLPQGGSVGFELFDKSSFGMTEFTEKLNYQRAVQGELTRTICDLAPVMGARVHIAIPEDRVYASEQQPATASVVLKLRRGMPLSDEQVGGIVHLVSSAVEGLRPSNVSVIDSEGNVLSEGMTERGGGSRLTATQSKEKRRLESEIAQNLQSMLARIVGPDKGVVRVSADMNFDQKQMKSETYEPVATPEGPRGIVLAEEKTTENYTGKVIPPNALTGNASGASPSDQYDRTQSTTKFEVNKRVEEVVSAPGQIKRLSVAVLVDESVRAGKVGAIREAVTAAAGIDLARGDQITVQRVAFDTTSKKALEAEMASASKLDALKSNAKNLGAILVLAVFLFLLRSIVRQIKVHAPTGAEPEPSIPSGLIAPPDAGAAIPIQNPANLLQQGPMPDFSPSQAQPFPGERAEEILVQEGLPAELEQSSPEDLAKLVRSWMAEQ